MHVGRICTLLSLGGPSTDVFRSGWLAVLLKSFFSLLMVCLFVLSIIKGTDVSTVMLNVIFLPSTSVQFYVRYFGTLLV